MKFFIDLLLKDISKKKPGTTTAVQKPLSSSMGINYSSSQKNEQPSTDLADATPRRTLR